MHPGSTAIRFSGDERLRRLQSNRQFEYAHHDGQHGCYRIRQYRRFTWHNRLQRTNVTLPPPLPTEGTTPVYQWNKTEVTSVPTAPPTERCQERKHHLLRDDQQCQLRNRILKTSNNPRP